MPGAAPDVEDPLGVFLWQACEWGEPIALAKQNLEDDMLQVQAVELILGAS
jgi:hypothetical protein